MTDLTQAQIDWCRARLPAFARAHDAARAAIASTAEYREKYGDALELKRARDELAAAKARMNAPIRWKWGSP